MSARSESPARVSMPEADDVWLARLSCGAGMPNGRGPYGARRVAIRKASAAIHRREFVPRDTAAIRSNHHLWCMPRWQAIESPLLAVEAAAYEERELSRRAESAGARRRARTAVHARRSRKQTRCKLEQGRVGSWNRDQLGSWELQLGVGTRISWELISRPFFRRRKRCCTRRQ